MIFELMETLYAHAKIEPVEGIYLWLGVHVIAVLFFIGGL